MTSKNCPVCGAENSLIKEEKDFTVTYAQTKLVRQMPVCRCVVCGAKFDADHKNDEIRKNALTEVRQESVSNTLSALEKEMSFTELEHCFSLSQKTLSKWKTKSKSPSAAAAAFVSLLGVFPWLSYVAMTNYDKDTAYKIAGAAFFKKATENERISAFCASNSFYDEIGLRYRNENVQTKTIDASILDYTPLQSSGVSYASDK